VLKKPSLRHRQRTRFKELPFSIPISRARTCMGMPLFKRCSIQMIRCIHLVRNGYDPEGKSKITLACEMFQAVPESTCPTYVLMDSRYPSSSVLQTSAKRGFHIINRLKTNRIFYPKSFRQSLKALLPTFRNGIPIW
jgi:hypothetical protein